MHSIGNYQDIRFIGSLSVSMPFTSLCLTVSNFAFCGMLFFLAGFYSGDFILEMLSMRCVNIFWFLVLFRSITFRFLFFFCGILMLFLVVLHLKLVIWYWV